MDETVTIIETTTDPLTLKPGKADSAVAFLNQWSEWLAEVIETIKAFFDRLTEAFASEGE